MTKDEIRNWHKDHPYQPRTEEYIDDILAHVKRLWMERPGERLGQVLCNESWTSDVFYVRDEEWVQEKVK